MFLRMFHSPNEVCLIPNLRLAVHPGQNVKTLDPIRAYQIKVEWLWWSLELSYVHELPSGNA